MKIEVKNEESPYKGLWLFDGYFLGNDSIDSENQKEALATCGLKLDTIDDNWIPVRNDGQPTMSWKQITELALKILNSGMTYSYCKTMHLEEIPKDEIADIATIDLPNHSFKSSKSILFTASKGGKLQSEFTIHGVNKEGSQIEASGRWLDWIKFATDVLSLQNTSVVCKRLFSKELSQKP